MARARSWLLVAVLAVGILATAIRPAIASDGATEVVRKLNDAVVAILQKDAPAEIKRAELRRIIDNYVDFQTMSRLVLARNWSTLTPPDRSEFVAQFKNYLGVTYGKNLESYRDERVEIAAERDEGRGDCTVQTRIVRAEGAGVILLDYRLRRIGGEWRIIDLLVERVSLVSSFRSQFQEIFASGGIVRLLGVLREKNGAAPPASG